MACQDSPLSWPLPCVSAGTLLQSSDHQATLAAVEVSTGAYEVLSQASVGWVLSKRWCTPIATPGTVQTPREGLWLHLQKVVLTSRVRR